MTTKTRTGYLGVQEVADLIGCHRDYVYDNATSLGGVKLAGQWKFWPDTLHRCIETKRLADNGTTARPVTGGVPLPSSQAALAG